jgi:hypothetical protein
MPELITDKVMYFFLHGPTYRIHSVACERLIVRRTVVSEAQGSLTGYGMRDRGSIPGGGSFL